MSESGNIGITVIAKIDNAIVRVGRNQIKLEDPSIIGDEINKLMKADLDPVRNMKITNNKQIINKKYLLARS